MRHLRPRARTPSDELSEEEAHALEKRRFDIALMLLDADRATMQLVSTSLSLIGFGFSIIAFFNDITGGGANRADISARRLGIALLSLGLLLLTLGLLNQISY